MKYVLIIIFSAVILSGCINQASKKNVNSEANTEQKISLEYIDSWNQIELIHTDDKYGEWGGDSDIITVYSDGKAIYVNYSRYLGSKLPPPPPKNNEESKKWYEYKRLYFKFDSVKLDKIGIELVKNAILELASQKIHNHLSFSNPGIDNRVVSRDSSLIIKDFPSSEWRSFQKLRNRLIKKEIE